MGGGRWEVGDVGMGDGGAMRVGVRVGVVGVGVRLSRRSLGSGFAWWGLVRPEERAGGLFSFFPFFSFWPFQPFGGSDGAEASPPPITARRSALRSGRDFIRGAHWLPPPMTGGGSSLHRRPTWRYGAKAALYPATCRVRRNPPAIITR